MSFYLENSDVERAEVCGTDYVNINLACKYFQDIINNGYLGLSFYRPVLLH
jgi:hypothetical protein